MDIIGQLKKYLENFEELLKTFRINFGIFQ